MTDLAMLRAERDRAREAVSFSDATCECMVGDPVDTCRYCQRLSALLLAERRLALAECADALEAERREPPWFSNSDPVAFVRRMLE